jgi:hypothetical protein
MLCYAHEQFAWIYNLCLEVNIKSFPFAEGVDSIFFSMSISSSMCAALFTGNVVLILVLAAALNADQVFQLPTAVVTECLQAVFHQALHPKLRAWRRLEQQPIILFSIKWDRLEMKHMIKKIDIK